MKTDKELLDEAIKLISSWCAAVEIDSSWDGWDYWYKRANYAKDFDLRELIDEEKKIIKKFNRRYNE